MIERSTMPTTAPAVISQQVVWEAAPRLDFRYEVTHKPTPEMFEAMMSVTPGMASAGQDPVVRELEARVAEMTGKEAAVFLPTTTNGTMLTLMNEDLRGQTVVMESRCHVYWVEQLHVSQFAGAAPLVVRGDSRGVMAIEDIDEAVNATAYGYKHRLGMVCLENTHNVCGGTVLSPDYTAQVGALAHEHGAGLYLDGARLFNAAVAQGVTLAELAAPADHVVVSLNKGLGAPMGAVLSSSAEAIAGVRVLAKRTGMISIHKAGMFAAAALVALDTMIDRLAEDHARIRHIAEIIGAIDGFAIQADTVETNLLRIDTSGLGISALEFANAVAEHGLGVHVLEPDAIKIAACYAIDDADVDEALVIITQVAEEVRT
jgi:threonine aldolase